MAAEDISLDLEELRHLQTIAKRPHVLTLISSEIRALEDKFMKVDVTEPAKEAPTRAKAPSIPATSYGTLSSFSWEQYVDKVKIYLSLEGVDQEKVEAEFKPTSFDIKFHDVGGKNYRCAIAKLNKEIVPKECKVVVKPKKVVITLIKASKGNWLDLHYKEDKVKPSVDKERDPMTGIMDLMKNMYDEGDEEMKRTIAKAWSDARSGKTADPLKGFN